MMMLSTRKKSFLSQLLVIMGGIVLLLFLFHGFFGKRGYFEMRRVKAVNRKLVQKLEELKAENKKVVDEIRALKTDPSVIEKIAREELGLVRKGEIKITPPRPRKESSNPLPSSQPAGSPGDPQEQRK